MEEIVRLLANRLFVNENLTKFSDKELTKMLANLLFVNEDVKQSTVILIKDDVDDDAYKFMNNIMPLEEFTFSIKIGYIKDINTVVATSLHIFKKEP